MTEDYEEKLLVALAEKYRKSKKDAGTGVLARRTRITPALLYKNYNRNDADMEKIEAVNKAVRKFAKEGFLTYETETFSNEIRSVYLVDEKIEAVEEYLEQNYGYESKASKRRYVEQLIQAYGGQSPAADMECEKLRQTLQKNRIPPRYLLTEDVLKALVFIEKNEEALFLREASMLIYGDSKHLEDDAILAGVCKALRTYQNRPCREGELEDEILGDYHIEREKQKLCLKGDVTVRIAGREVEIGAFADGVEFFASDLKHLEWIHVHTPVFMTVENRTSWLRIKNVGTTHFYLGGYVTRQQRDFLKKVYSDNPGIVFLHFGDIDAGGFYIHEHLCRSTGICFGMYRMSCAELQDARFCACLHPLTEQDRVRLRSLTKQDRYRQVAEYMLEKNQKLEQEIISYYETDF